MNQTESKATWFLEKLERMHNVKIPNSLLPNLTTQTHVDIFVRCMKSLVLVEKMADKWMHNYLKYLPRTSAAANNPNQIIYHLPLY